jgi:hypothetical protein
VSVENSSIWLSKKKYYIDYVTVFFCSVLARCSAPGSPISLPLSSRQVSVCEE